MFYSLSESLKVKIKSICKSSYIILIVFHKMIYYHNDFRRCM